ncbi:dolichyl-phosphate-mannose-protein mannosyltransferase [Thermomonospora umbrina]|uniref:Polyprenol-phosphate-mannose--protein mannosyltransferase n=1 Tax=Thermomonospora umbrina TaxID=111806 RepID=A0A3D9SJV7_9ACTN|nr:phospholipid carrier-dependent glycosyltransferase [Thermomonospora umbrina]REE96202.1 dolichyl-phosphate-mannose-protein mannosyltransferase [Thermomonospora umbrina]
MTEIESATTPAAAHRRPASLRDWLAPPIPGSALWGWLGPLFVTLFAGFLRFDRLGVPKAVVFDETYYAKDAWALLKFGWEHKTVKDADSLLIRDGSDAKIWEDGASFVAHPPGGKWMIAIGEAIFGATPFGWRFTAALAGTLSVLILCRVARRMTGSTLLGCAAGLLLAVDGLAFVTSRTALLDVFVMFWVLAGFACLLIDRDRSRRALAEKVEDGVGGSLGPFVMHWWRVAAGVCLGLACAVKWSGIFFIAAFGIMVVLWDAGARRAARVRNPYAGAIGLDALPSFVSLVVVGLLTYLATWAGWIFKPGGWGRGEVAGNPLLRPLEAMPDLWRHHKDILDFHNGLTTAHTYQSWPWDWPILRRPVAFFYTEPRDDCAAARCSREILGIGTPAFWWGATIALIVLVGVWLVRRDWRAGAILLGFMAGWLPWFVPAFGDRTMFLFYATPMLPFMALAVALALGLLIGPARQATVHLARHAPSANRRLLGSAVAGAYLLMVLVNFAYFYPVLAAKIIPYEDWDARIWFNSWI